MSLSTHKRNEERPTSFTFDVNNDRTLASNEFQKRKFQFLLELSCLLFTHKDKREISQIISELIVFTLSIEERHFLDKVYTKSKPKIIAAFEPNDYYIILKKIQTFLFQCNSLPNKKKVRFNQLEWFCMRRYSQEIKKRILKRS